ncbi:peroxide stress protein YaaA [Mediterraneibacter glycyrrhizinilyticus]|uniref:peroxide stress protein YaaA n=1 Tax=Mediterraneibacter glycyrrhizinilyticus TaxID=342942 RepID=UPI0025AA63D1|nr:peroxide stress protein YaaA [Mediterraneibacter glycyrrhizinilyticus]MCF2568996.1 peroxide stress protein YaaA [Mediterraneibacter glycyrrhizinilyticus]MDN0042662.1 peroxide stress protein YaaA [Mediterraneibacter glycyrrhizinilyticus]
MKIIISPAKKMNIDTDTLAFRSMPSFLSETEELLAWMRRLTFAEAKAIWKCNDKIAEQNYRRFQEMDLERNLTPAVIAYEGIQYQYMAPAVFGGAQTDYIQEHLRILSGFYGVLKPFDGVTPYRLEMQAKASEAGDLYKFWGDKLYREVAGEEKDGGLILNLASKEYSKCIEKYLTPEDTYVTVVFGELADGKVKQKGTLAKMARGEMVRYLAENKVEDPERIKGFDRLGYCFEETLSNEKEYVFLKHGE